MPFDTERTTGKNSWQPSVALVLSYEDYQASTQTIPFHVATLISENYPPRGKGVAGSM